MEEELCVEAVVIFRFLAALGIVSTALLARNLTTREFGSYAFAVSFLTFVALVFDFGFFAPAARLTAFRRRY